MKENIISVCLLIISTLLILFINSFIKKTKSNNQINKVFSINFMLIALWSFSMIMQICFSKYISPIYFDYIAYIGICFIPISLLFTGRIFASTKVKFTKKHLLLFIVPIISLFVLWTNDLHHLFYVRYSIYTKDTLFGPYFYAHTVYSYTCIAIGLIHLITYSIKNSGFFSKQSLLIFFGILISTGTNILVTLGVLNLSIYATPITFAITILFLALAVFKFDFLRVAPIALQRIVDRISDSYIVINENNKIIDFNKTFLDTFRVKASDIRNKNLFEINDMNSDSFKNILADIEKSGKTITIQKHFNSIDKYFNIEINTITNKGSFLGTLILLKDVTQHNKDMQTIKDNQDMLVEKERLASLGQMIGGIAHNLKTPIMSIAGASEGLSDLIKEYDSSIGDPEVTEEDHHEIAKDMDKWIEKIRTHLSYMSDIITAIKGQAVAFSEQTASGFTVKELINYVDILMKHELKNALTSLNLQVDLDTSTKVKGNINSLVQVINNVISNSIQAYQSQGKTNESIDFRVYRENDNLVFRISDKAGGLSKKVQNKLFKEMVTTKGKNGTGLGLFMSYSNIKAHFSGNLRYETKEGKGTTFFIEIPM